MSTNAFLWQEGSPARMPLGVNHIYPSVTLPGFLESSNLIDGDRQETTNPSNIWEVVSGAWKIRQATRGDKASLPSSDVITGALGFVDSTRYFYSGFEWVRTPISTKYKYQVSSYGALPVTDTVENLDTGFIDNSPFFGWVEYDGAIWWYSRVVCALVGDLPSSNVFEGCLAEVGSFGSYVIYRYNGSSWEGASSGGDGVVWDLTDVDVIPIGAKEGDYGIYNSKVFRLKNVTINAAAGGGTMPTWLPPEVYAGTVAIQAYLVGTEVVTDDTALNAQGWSTVTRTNGSITSQTTRVRLATSAASGIVSITALTSGVTPATRIYARALIRVAVGTQSGSSSTTVIFPWVCDGANSLLAAHVSPDRAKGTFFWLGTSNASSGIDLSPQAAVAGLAGPDDLIEVLIHNTGSLGYDCQLYRNGVLVSVSNPAGIAASDRVEYRAGSGPEATQTSTLDLSQVVVMTW